MSENVKLGTKPQARKFDVRKLAFIALLTAVVVVVQVLSGMIMFGPFSITLALTPIIVGAALYGWKAGAWLGLVFGAVTLTNAGLFLSVNAPGAVAVCILKGALAGAAAGLVYKPLKKKNAYVAVTVAAAVCPLVNTAVFILGCLTFFMGAITEWANGGNAFAFIFTGLITVNFFVEFGVNLVLSPIVFRIIRIGKKSING